jgi:HSP20 family molecular chaperone IbpA
MMVSAFNSPLMLGFDHLERLLEQVSKSGGEGYPPYNIEQIGTNRLRITLAVAGFTIDDLSIAMEGNQLVIRGKKKQDDRSKVFLHRGIATRQFQRSFVLAEEIEVVGASLDNGLLNIDLKRELPDTAVRTIKIARGGPGKAVEQAPLTIDLTPDA